MKPRVVLGRRALLSAALSSATAVALGRKPYGGVLRLELPFAVDALEPYGASDVVTALVVPMIADPLFALDSSGAPYPALAAGLPAAAGADARVALRPGLRAADGRHLDARDVVRSLERARDGAGRPLFAGMGTVTRDPSDPLGVIVASTTPDSLSRALASPVTAIFPHTGSLDGTGAFRIARRDATTLVLARNLHAARGPSFLDSVELRRAADLAAPLRAFETGRADVGFLGAGLHRAREGSVPLRGPPLGFVVLRTGADAGAWGAPGVATRLVSGLGAGVLAHLGLAPAAEAGGDPGWGGPAAELLVDERSAYFVEVARVVSGVLSRPGHEIRPLPLSQRELSARLSTNRFALAVDFVRSLGPTPRHALLALLAAADPRLAEVPPRVAPTDLAVITRTLPLAVLGEVSLSGARTEDFVGLEADDPGSVYRRPR